jgi:protein-tyrosine phosphatase
MFDPGGRYVMLEPPRLGDCSRPLAQTVFALQLHGITPIIAHPEHVEGFTLDPSLWERVVDQGALTQLTAATLVEAEATGRHREAVNRLRRGLVHVVASDAHDAEHRPPILSAARDVASRLLDEERARLLVETNPSNILAGRDIVPLSPSQGPEPSRLSRLFTNLRNTFR